MGRNASIQIGDSRYKLTVLDVIPSNKSGKHAKIKVQCVCGVIKEMQTPIYNKSKSCGCSRYTDLKPRIQKELTDNAAFNSLYATQYGRRAAQRGYTFQLSKEQFRSLTSANCHYCGIEPHRIHRSGRSEYTYNGIDRADNSIGYTFDNSRSACFTCNQAKHSMTTQEFESWLQRLILHHSKKR